MATLTDHERSSTLRIGSFTLLWAYLSPMFGRMGFCVTLLYLTGTDPRVPKWPIWGFLGLQFLINVAVIIVFFTQCGTQLELMWSTTQAGMMKYLTTCLDPRIQTDLGYFQGAFNTLTDAFLTVLPALLIEHTRQPMKTKIGLGLLLCLSMLAMVASIVKTYEARALSAVLDYTCKS